MGWAGPAAGQSSGRQGGPASPAPLRHSRRRRSPEAEPERMVVVVGTGQGCSLRSTGNGLLAIPSASVASNEVASRTGPLLSSCFTLGFRDF
ncbi:unnamed protein product [Rangifer tarandus platyrhynchus]|uniref:Uncharacterized protein n=2 Tax=Rangifer tarandus platyrhynchus TaxID=3082113 RepID=A0ABN9A255_RANTA|nr:unnamed protein product [Rangifer tarandus platyrhynchus]CAI9712167.1 unnamed protein product [Rangifer tarandus platyrhynchus]